MYPMYENYRTNIIVCIPLRKGKAKLTYKPKPFLYLVMIL